MASAVPPRPARRRPEPEARRLVAMITGCWRTQALRAAVQLGLPEHLATGPCGAPALAEACGGSADGVLRLLRALCALRVCRERRDGRFQLTCTGTLLCQAPSGHGPSLRALALWWGGPLWPLWNELVYSVQSGHSARARPSGQAHYDFLEGQPELAALFHDTMRAMTALVANDLAALPTWRQARTLVDVGGGSGELAAAIAAAHPQLQATVLDRPDAGPSAQAVFARHGVAARTRFVAGDFFAPLPPGADRYLLKSILHNWDDTACQRLLAGCAAAAPAGARLLLVERVRPERLHPTPHDEALARTDLNMLAGLGGRERTLPEFTALLAGAGFDTEHTWPTRHEFSVIEARRR